MKVKLSKNDTIKLNKLFDRNEKNKMIADINLNILYESKNIAENFDTNISFLDNIAKYFKIDQESYDILKQEKLNHHFILLNKLDYQNNPYIKNIKLENIKENDYTFLKQNYIKNECFLFDEIQVEKDYKENTLFGYFNEDFSYISLLEKNDIWMLITPHEINTMKNAISLANGKIITYGLGLGYFAYMVSLKENVQEITIVEKDSTIISLFNQYILPQFSHPEKIHIICDDAIHFIKNSTTEYDFAFVDLYKDVNDGLPLYIKMLHASLKHQKTNYQFWIEKSMLIMIRRCLISLIYENYYQLYYDSEESFYDILLQKFQILLNETKFTTYEQITEFLSDENIKKILYNVEL